VTRVYRPVASPSPPAPGRRYTPLVESANETLYLLVHYASIY
jgi:hypothetical protein